MKNPDATIKHSLKVIPEWNGNEVTQYFKGVAEDNGLIAKGDRYLEEIDGDMYYSMEYEKAPTKPIVIPSETKPV